MSVQGTPLSRQEERLVWPWMSFYGRMSPGFATDSVDMDCGIWPILPALGGHPGHWGGGRGRFLQPQRATPSSRQVSLTSPQGGLRHVQRPPGPAWRGGGREGCSHAPGKGGGPGLSWLHHSGHMVGARERGAPPASPPLSSGHSGRSVLSGVQLPCLTLRAQFLPHSVSPSPGTQGSSALHHLWLGELGRQARSRGGGAQEVTRGCLPSHRRRPGGLRRPAQSIGPDLSPASWSPWGDPARQAGAGRCGGSVLQERGHAGCTRATLPGPAAPQVEVTAAPCSGCLPLGPFLPLTAEPQEPQN